MTKTIAVLLTLIGAVGLVLGIIGIFGSNLVSISPWALAIIGIIFFTAGIGILKRTSNQPKTNQE